MSTEEKQSHFIEKAITLLEKKGYDQIKANHPGYEQPGKFIQQGTNEEFMPDLTAITLLGKDYFKVVEGDKEHEQAVVSKWKLFSNIAQIKNGQFFLLVPYGKKKYTKELVDRYNIQANLLSLSR